MEKNLPQAVIDAQAAGKPNSQPQRWWRDAMLTDGSSPHYLTRRLAKMKSKNDDSKQDIWVEQLKSKIIEKLSPKVSEAMRKVLEVTNSITNISQTIEQAEEKLLDADNRLRQLTELKNPDKNTIDAVSALVIENQTFEQALKGWNKRLEDLQNERKKALHVVRNEVDQVFMDVKKALQEEVDAEETRLLALLVSVEDVFEQCRFVGRYVPDLKRIKGIDEVVPMPPYYMWCPPKDLWRYLKGKMRASGGL